MIFLISTELKESEAYNLALLWPVYLCWKTLAEFLEVLFFLIFPEEPIPKSFTDKKIEQKEIK